MALAGCGGAPVPAEDVTQSKAAISAAEAVGAQSVPNAALYLKMAKDNVAKAESLIKDGNNEEANLFLLEAQSDAELSLSLAREEGMKQQANEAMKKVETLKKH
jgi:hypothetical protein